MGDTRHLLDLFVDATDQDVGFASKSHPNPSLHLQLRGP